MNATTTTTDATLAALPHGGRWYVINDSADPVSALELESCNDRDTLDEIDALLVGDSTVVGMCDRVLRIA